MGSWAVFVVAFLATAVEMVEAATLVLAVSLTRGRQSALTGAGTAFVVLVVLVALFGPLLSVIPLAPLRLVVGTLSLLFGLDWLRKAILRAGGRKALHDEAAIFESERRATTGLVSTMFAGVDRLGFVVSFKAVLLEGLEVVVIVLTIGAAQRNLGVAAVGAVVASIVVVIAASLLGGPLTRVPENLMKMCVGVMLVSFGTFWAGEGVGVEWPGDALSIPLLAVWFGAIALVTAGHLRRTAVVDA